MTRVSNPAVAMSVRNEPSLVCRVGASRSSRPAGGLRLRLTARSTWIHALRQADHHSASGDAPCVERVGDKR